MADRRFPFGKNWTRFLAHLDDERVAEAERSLADLLGVRSLAGLSFVDVGSGSGLFSLAATRLGAARVHSFDYDPDSVACTAELKRRFLGNASHWSIARGSVLDGEYVGSLGTFDVVYSWGVLHHTGDMWGALAKAAELVKHDGRLVIALYNDQGGASRRWLRIKRFYNASPAPVRFATVLTVGAYWELRGAVGRLTRLENPLPFETWRRKKRDRGMSPWFDLVDWVGGYPFEVAKPDDVLAFYRERGFVLTRLVTCGHGHGNNQFVFARSRG